MVEQQRRTKDLGGNFTANCQACHGGTSRSNSCGTPLSRVLATRTFSAGTRGQTGQPVGCAVCHSDELLGPAPAYLTSKPLEAAGTPPP